MNIEKDLKKDGITVIEPLNTLSITLIAKFVAEKLVSAFPFYGFNYDKLFIKLSNIPMYIANIPSSMGEANYFYKNSSIYFKEGLLLDDMKNFAVHEFIHAYQELKDKNNVLYRLGLCDFTGLKVTGMALNEAAVQLMASKALNAESEAVKYYDIEFNTNTPNCYPIICNLVNQMSYLIGENVLFDSTINSNNKFSKSLIAICGHKNYKKIINNLDKILKLEEKMALISGKLEEDILSETFIVKASTKVGNYKKLIKNTFFETQNIILASYFNKSLDNVYSSQEIKNFRKKLYHYRDLLGTNQDYTFFNDYYINMMIKLDEKYETLNNPELALVPYSRSIFQIILEKLHALFASTKKISDIQSKEIM